MTENKSGPIGKRQRIDSLDIVRGFAMLGILLANITAFAQSDLAYYWPPAMPGGASEGDKWVWLAQFVLVDGKFRALFAMLFGAGLALFAARCDGEGRGLVLQARRLIWLALFGLLHFYLLFTGDILFSYAVAGLIAMLMLPWEARQLLYIGCGWAIVGAFISLSNFAGPALVEMQPHLASPDTVDALSAYALDRLGEARTQLAVHSGESLWALLLYRWEDHSGDLWIFLVNALTETVPLMLIGMGLYRAGLFTDGELRRRWRRAAWLALGAGAIANLAVGLLVMRSGFPLLQTQAAFFGLLAIANLPMLPALMLLLTDWAAASRDSWLGERLANVGRMAFSNYIGTSLVMVLIFQGWAGGLAGTMHRVELLLIVALGWALMLTFSRLWLARLRMGPLEWLWRCLTYGRLFAIRK